MSFYFNAYFSDNGSPKTGLSATIDVYDLSDNSKVVNAQAMTEVGGGLYKYLYSSYDPEKNYAAVADGSATLTNSSERYVACAPGINVLGEVLEGTTTLQEALRIMLAALAGKASISGNDVSFRDVGDTKDRIVATTDANGQRSAVTLDGS